MKLLAFRPLLTATALASLLGLGACKDYLEVDPISYNTRADTFANVDGATGAVIGTYDMLSGDDTYGKGIAIYYPYDTDEFIGLPGPLEGARKSIARYYASSLNAEVTKGWNALYQGIERANICIKYIPQMPQYEGGSASEKTTLRRLHGEALALRAQFFYELVRNWGDVPAPFEPSIVGVEFPNVDRNLTLSHLLDDLNTAADKLGWASEHPGERERFSKGGIKALRARIALARGGYSLHGLQMTRPADFGAFYQIARNECDDLMKSNEHALNPNFYDVFYKLSQDQSDATHELMLEVAHGVGSSTAGSDSKLGYFNGPLMNSPIFGNASGTIKITPPYFYAFDSTDLRRDLTLGNYSRGTTGSTGIPGDNKRPVKLTAVTDGKFRRDWHNPPVPGGGNYLGYNWPLIRFADVLLMFAEAENEVHAGPTPEAYEAINRIRRRGHGLPIATAAPGVDLPTGLSQADFFTAVMKERYVELGGEGIRKYDLLRWNKLGDRIAYARAQMAKMSAGQPIDTPYGPLVAPTTMYYNQTGTAGTSEISPINSYYRPAPTGASVPVVPAEGKVNWAKASDLDPQLVTGPSGIALTFVAGTGKELLPIPQSSIDTTPGLVQNAGY